MEAFSQKYPDVRLEFHSMGTDEQAKALKQARIHVGFVVSPVQTSELVTERISSEPRLLALSANHPLARRRRVPLFLTVAKKVLAKTVRVDIQNKQRLVSK